MRATICFTVLLTSSVPYLPSDILPLTDYGTTIKSLHTKAVFDSKSLLSHYPVLQTVSPQIAPEEVKLPRFYRTTLLQFRQSFCSSLLSYHEKIGLIPSPSCGQENHTTVFILSPYLIIIIPAICCCK